MSSHPEPLLDLSTRPRRGRPGDRASRRHRGIIRTLAWIGRAAARGSGDRGTAARTSLPGCRRDVRVPDRGHRPGRDLGARRADGRARQLLPPTRRPAIGRTAPHRCRQDLPCRRTTTQAPRSWSAQRQPSTSTPSRSAKAAQPASVTFTTGLGARTSHSSSTNRRRRAASGDRPRAQWHARAGAGCCAVR